ncbi:MAG: 50S ribosomal protein L20 [Saprospiraceae bacterium]
MGKNRFSVLHQKRILCPRSVTSCVKKTTQESPQSSQRIFWRKKNVWTVAKNAVDRARAFAYVGRKLKKRAYRRLWITDQCGVRINGTTYSKLMAA